MPSSHRITVNVAPEFEVWLTEYAAQHHYTSLAQALVHLASDEVKKEGFTGQLMLPRGKYERQLKEAMDTADQVTDFGRNDPEE